MPCLSGRFNPAVGILVNLVILPAGSLESSSLRERKREIETVPALLDTGASITCISQKAAEEAGLEPIGMRPMMSATGTAPRRVYLADLILAFGEVGGMIRSSMQVMEFAYDPQSPFQALIGRDIICSGVLTVSFDGRFTFSI